MFPADLWFLWSFGYLDAFRTFRNDDEERSFEFGGDFPSLASTSQKLLFLTDPSGSCQSQTSIYVRAMSSWINCQCSYWTCRPCSVSASPQLRFGCAEDAVRLLHLRPAVAGVVHLQAVVELVQVLLHLLDLLPRHMLQAKTNLDDTQTARVTNRLVLHGKNRYGPLISFDQFCLRVKTLSKDEKHWCNQDTAAHSHQL